jgi:hypothetical protein
MPAKAIMRFLNSPLLAQAADEKRALTGLSSNGKSMLRK